MMKKLEGIERIEVLQVDIDNAEGKKRCPIFQSIKREFGIETKIRFDAITSLFDRACFNSIDYILGQFGYIGVDKEMVAFMKNWDSTQTAVPTTFAVNSYPCRDAASGRRTIMEYYNRHASFKAREEIETYLGL